MLKIGEFSELTGISIHMLRNYDKIGLLKPEQIDRMNNYRFYGEKQIVRANHIQVLKSLGFGLNEITEILMDSTTDDRIRTFLETKIREKEEGLSMTERQIAQMRQARSPFIFLTVGAKRWRCFHTMNCVMHMSRGQVH